MTKVLRIIEYSWNSRWNFYQIQKFDGWKSYFVILNFENNYENERKIILNIQSVDILDGIKKLRDDGATIVYTTHYMEEVEILCDRVIILDKGKILAQGTTEEVKELAKIDEKVTNVESFVNEKMDSLKKFNLFN